jgi:hypothetical protein
LGAPEDQVSRAVKVSAEETLGRIADGTLLESFPNRSRPKTGGTMDVGHLADIRAAIQNARASDASGVLKELSDATVTPKETLRESANDGALLEDHCIHEAPETRDPINVVDDFMDTARGRELPRAARK